MARTGIGIGAAAALLFAAAQANAATVKPSLSVENGRFELTLADGKRLSSSELVGAELVTQQGQAIRIDAVAPAAERRGVLLHSLSVKDPAKGVWSPVCQADAYGRAAGFPVAGRWTARGRFVKDKRAWFLTCTLGSQGKCVLWGYDPWRRGSHGEDLAPFYQACQTTVRADYDGRGQAHTRNGTSIDVYDVLGIATADTRADPRYAFEAGWGPGGAVCVARTRWPDLLSREALLAAEPRLGGRCDEATARRRGALIFTRTMIAPVLASPPPLPQGTRR